MSRFQFIRWIRKQKLINYQVRMAVILFDNAEDDREAAARAFVAHCQRPKVYEQLKLFSERS